MIVIWSILLPAAVVLAYTSYLVFVISLPPCICILLLLTCQQMRVNKRLLLLSIYKTHNQTNQNKQNKNKNKMIHVSFPTLGTHFFFLLLPLLFRFVFEPNLLAGTAEAGACFVDTFGGCLFFFCFLLIICFF
jgi:hypothetical protein